MVPYEKGGERVAAAGNRRVWVAPTLTFEGTVEDLVLVLPGKLSVSPGDPGEAQKVPTL